GAPLLLGELWPDPIRSHQTGLNYPHWPCWVRCCSPLGSLPKGRPCGNRWLRSALERLSSSLPSSGSGRLSDRRRRNPSAVGNDSGTRSYSSARLRPCWRGGSPIPQTDGKPQNTNNRKLLLAETGTDNRQQPENRTDQQNRILSLLLEKTLLLAPAFLTPEVL